MNIRQEDIFLDLYDRKSREETISLFSEHFPEIENSDLARIVDFMYWRASVHIFEFLQTRAEEFREIELVKQTDLAVSNHRSAVGRLLEIVRLLMIHREEAGYPPFRFEDFVESVETSSGCGVYPWCSSAL